MDSISLAAHRNSARRSKLDEQEWKKIEPYIERLYPTLSLKEMKSKLNRDVGFNASERQYTHRLNKMGLNKYNLRGDTTTKERALIPNTLFRPERRKILEAGQFFLSVNNLAAANLMYPVINKHTSIGCYIIQSQIGQTDDAIQKMLQDSLGPAYRSNAIDYRVSLQGYGRVVHNLAVTYALGAIASGSNDLKDAASKFFDKTNDAKCFLPQSTRQVITNLLHSKPLEGPDDFSDEGFTTPSNNNGPAFGCMDLVTYAIITRLVETSTESNTQDRWKKARDHFLSQQEIVAKFSNNAEGDSKSDLLKTCINWCKDRLNRLVQSKCTLGQNIEGIANSSSANDRLMAVYCALWAEMYKEQELLEKEDEAHRQAEILAAKISQNRKGNKSPYNQGLGSMNLHTTYTYSGIRKPYNYPLPTSYDPLMNDLSPQEVSEIELDTQVESNHPSVRWARGSFYFLGIPPSLLLYIILNVCFQEVEETAVSLSSSAFYVAAHGFEIMSKKTGSLVWDLLLEQCTALMLPDDGNLGASLGGGLGLGDGVKAAMYETIRATLGITVDHSVFNQPVTDASVGYGLRL